MGSVFLLSSCLIGIFRCLLTLSLLSIQKALIFSLSFFTYRGRTERSLEVEVAYFDLQLNWQQETFKFGLARLIQHEYDHLDGILYTERMPPGEQLISYEEYVRLKETGWN